MKYIKGLYITLLLMMLTILINTTFLDDKFSGIAMFLCLGFNIVGTIFYINGREAYKEGRD